MLGRFHGVPSVFVGCRVNLGMDLGVAVFCSFLTHSSDSESNVFCRTGEATSEVRGPGFRGPKVTPCKDGKVDGFDQLFFGKGPF